MFRVFDSVKITVNRLLYFVGLVRRKEMLWLRLMPTCKIRLMRFPSFIG